MVIPNYVNVLVNQHFNCEGRELTILQRVNDVNLKGYLYLLDYRTHQYISNLKKVDDKTFLFDFRNGPKYMLILDEEKCSFEIVKR